MSAHRLLALCSLLPAVAFAEPPAAEGPKLGEAAPAFTLKTINPELSKEKAFTLLRHVGEGAETPKKAVVLSFAASYCEPCKKELAELGAWKERFDKGGVSLAVVIIDTEPEGLELMRKLTVDQLKLGYPVVADRFGVVARRYRAVALPYTVVVDKDGSIQWMHSGFQEKSLEQLAAKVGL